MNRYIIIRSDTKSISSPMCKHDAIKKIKEYDSKGICSYLVCKNKYIDINYVDKKNIYIDD